MKPSYIHTIGSFNNYVDRILPFFDPPTPHLVHVVIELPPHQISGHFSVVAAIAVH